MVPKMCNDDARAPTRREYVESGRRELKGRLCDTTECDAQALRHIFFHLSDVAERTVELRRRSPPRRQRFVLQLGERAGVFVGNIKGDK